MRIYFPRSLFIPISKKNRSSNKKRKLTHIGTCHDMTAPAASSSPRTRLRSRTRTARSIRSARSPASPHARSRSRAQNDTRMINKSAPRLSPRQRSRQTGGVRDGQGPNSHTIDINSNDEQNGKIEEKRQKLTSHSPSDFNDAQVKSGPPSSYENDGNNVNADQANQKRSADSQSSSRPRSQQPSRGVSSHPLKNNDVKNSAFQDNTSYEPLEVKQALQEMRVCIIDKLKRLEGIDEDTQLKINRIMETHAARGGVLDDMIYLNIEHLKTYLSSVKV